METNWTLILTYIIAILVEIGLPVTLAVLIVRKWKMPWVVVLTGVLTFIGSQVVHIPMLQIPALLQKLGMNITLPSAWPIGFYALYLGLYAGLCEETARWVGYKALKTKAASYKSAFALGIGHGGVESVIVGLLVAVSLISALFFNPDTLRASGVAEGTVQMTIAQVAQFWATPWHLPLASAVERITAVSAQLLMSVMVWKAVSQKKWLWYVLAVAYHAIIDGAAVLLTSFTSDVWTIEAALLIFLVIDVVFLVLFWKHEKAKEQAAVPAAV